MSIRDYDGHQAHRYEPDDDLHGNHDVIPERRGLYRAERDHEDRRRGDESEGGREIPQRRDDDIYGPGRDRRHAEIPPWDEDERERRAPEIPPYEDEDAIRRRDRSRGITGARSALSG